MKGDSRPRDRNEVMRSTGWAGARNHAGANVYLRPARYLADGSEASWPIVIIDDVTLSMATRIAGKYRSAVIETSKDNCQAWIACDRPLIEAERKAVQLFIIERLGEKNSDAGSQSGEHFGRAPGFRNKKPTRNNDLVRLVCISAADVPPYSTAEALAASTQKLDGVRVSPPSGRGSVVVASRKTKRNGESGESHKEFKFACIALQHGDDEQQIIESIAHRAHERGKRDTYAEALEYAELTVRNAKQRIGK